MLDELIRLVDRHGNILNLSIEYGKVTDWTIDIEHRICIGKYEPIVSVQSCDLTRCAAEAYIKTTEWLSEHNGGY